MFSEILKVFKHPLLVFGAGISIGLNLILVPRFGIIGAAYTTLLSFTF